MSIYAKLAVIQQNLKAPKSQTNKFGGYKYRNCEDILQAVKPLLGDLVLNLSDTIEQVGDRYYIKATASINDGKESASVTAYAREEENKKGMDASQITGSASSYARKYALNGLLAIDDTKDADSQPPSTGDVTKLVTKAQAKKLADLIESLPSDKAATVSGWIDAKFGGVDNLTVQAYQTVISKLEAA